MTVCNDSFLADVKDIISSARNETYASINKIALFTYWRIGKRIVEEEQRGTNRAEYGKSLIKLLAKELTGEFGTVYSERNLRNYRRFYILFSDFEIWNARVPNLSWTHFRCLLRVNDENARLWYMNEAASQGWSSRTLDRNIGTQYYYRLMQSPKKELVIEEMKNKTANLQVKPANILKDPVIAEFLGFKAEDTYVEADLEQAILDHIRDFLLEMGRGFAFVARQQHIVTDVKDYYIDLVFYNIELKCYVLVDLKMGTISHQDVGQMDMYIRMYDDLKCGEGDNPTIGLVLCSETSEDIAKYSILNDHDNIFMAKYMTCLPTLEQLQREIEGQKNIFALQQKSK